MMMRDNVFVVMMTRLLASCTGDDMTRFWFVSASLFSPANANRRYYYNIIDVGNVERISGGHSIRAPLMSSPTVMIQVPNPMVHLQGICLVVSVIAHQKFGRS
jgi:hypothetical protein